MKGIVVLLAIALWALLSQADAQEKEITYKHRTIPVLDTITIDVQSYEKDPKNKPKIDYKPTGKTSQPKSAGVSHLKSAQIIGGSNAALKQFPWQVYIIINNSWLCGGSLISANVVLTAAHCAYGGTSFQVTAGGLQRSTTETYEKTISSQSSKVHENYDDYWLVNDIAVIKLPQSFTLNLYINVIRLPKVSDASKTFAGTAVTVSGYGMTANTGAASNVLKFVGLNVTTNAKCAAVYGTSTVISSCLCTAPNPTKSTCSGDSGGPLVYKESDGKFTQIGVVSFGAAASCTNYPSGFARVTSFLGWISTQTGLKFRA